MPKSYANSHAEPPEASHDDHRVHIIAMMNESKQPAAIGEFELIAALERVLDEYALPPDMLIGIGDDAAAVRTVDGAQVLTTDTMVDGVHFRRGEADWGDVGWKSAVSNLSDIAAMGATPLHALVTLGVPADVTADEMEKMYRGMAAAFSEFGGGIVGGDIVSSPVFFVTVALTGQATVIDGKPALLRRDQARPGDLIGVTGRLGGSAGGFKALNEHASSQDAEKLKRYHFRPVPRIEQGKRLVEAGLSCAMDVSDGLVADLEKLCAASEVGAVLDTASIPLPPELKALYPEDALNLALTGGEDYELLFTAPFDTMDRLLARHRGQFTYIGRVVEEPDAGDRVSVLNTDGTPLKLARKGWDHLGAR
jgi:thiamine-monophosphate kinase